MTIPGNISPEFNRLNTRISVVETHNHDDRYVIVDNHNSSRIANNLTVGNTLTVTGRLFADNEVIIDNDLLVTKHITSDSMYISNNLSVRGDMLLEGRIMNNDLTNRLANLESKLNNLVDVFYPVGTVYTSFNSTDPSILFGGTWESIVDRFLYCANIVGGSGVIGESTKITIANLPAYNHRSSGLTTNSTGAHTHRLRGYGNTLGSGSTGWRTGVNGTQWQNGGVESSEAHSHTISGNTASTGNGSDYMPRYITVFAWRRTD
jgi:hypothetical protein